METDIRIHQSLINGFTSACVNLEIIAGSEFLHLPDTDGSSQWLPLALWLKLQDIVEKKYTAPSPIMVQVGREMMMGWYHDGPGKSLIKTGTDFISHQTGSRGYRGVVKGNSSDVGDFELLEMDMTERYARIRSTTPFNRDMEKGVIFGGMKAPGDLVYIDISNERDKDIFTIHYF